VYFIWVLGSRVTTIQWPLCIKNSRLEVRSESKVRAVHTELAIEMNTIKILCTYSDDQSLKIECHLRLRMYVWMEYFFSLRTTCIFNHCW